ncbi:MAG: UrcA family protein [Brevundimonas sp.]|uniref:UrcA family protein n=1 Tax=Brevundimonas sp. TaxID=1871086 RepID=UPI0027369861|nr:UrcA family protein [Brevundimonas sp.]MDP3403583.1 UrcA family protein [Brevundimonas sp.]
MHKFAFAFIAATVIASASAAAAQDYPVAYGDLDLGTVEGAATFDTRVRQTAGRACRGGTLIANTQCRLRFRDEALRQLPTARRDDYARARANRVLAMVPTIYG